MVVKHSSCFDEVGRNTDKGPTGDWVFKERSFYDCKHYWGKEIKLTLIVLL
jgi:hypothetical protein